MNATAAVMRVCGWCRQSPCKCTVVDCETGVERPAVTVTRERPPLVVAPKGGSFAWIQKGIGFTLHPTVGEWHPLVDAEGLGGTVLTADQVTALVAEFGRPV